MSNDTFPERLAYPKGLKGIIANESALSDVRGEEGRLLYLTRSMIWWRCAVLKKWFICFSTSVFRR